MSEARYAMKNRRLGIGIQTAHDDEGRAYLESVRRMRPDLFGRCKIVEVLQFLPSELPNDVVYELGGDIIGPPLGGLVLDAEVSP